MEDTKEIQDDKEVAKELFNALKEDTSKVSVLTGEQLYSKQLNSGEEIIANATFESIGLKDDLVKGLYSMGIEKPTIIQNLAITQIIKGKNAAFQSKSGTGKTMAFTIAALQKAEAGKGPQILILSPTRELSTQIGNEVKRLASSLGMRVCIALSDFNEKTIEEEIIVGTPGKTVSLINSSVIVPENIKMLIFDEADDLISNHTFMSITIKLLKTLDKAQKIFFSATYSDLSKKALDKLVPSVEKFLDVNAKADNIHLYYLELKKNEKMDALNALLEYLTVAQTIVFVATKQCADNVADRLKKEGFSVSAIHSNMTPEERDASVKSFLSANTKVLVSTNVFSRGMDIPQVNLIVNYDIPVFSNMEEMEVYIHRIGRSGRFNRAGFVIDFVTGKDEFEALAKIQSRMNSTSKKFSLKSLQEAFIESEK